VQENNENLGVKSVRPEMKVLAEAFHAKPCEAGCKALLVNKEILGPESGNSPFDKSESVLFDE